MSPPVLPVEELLCLFNGASMVYQSMEIGQLHAAAFSVTLACRDGCSHMCKVEATYHCTVDPGTTQSRCYVHCGNGKCEEFEESSCIQVLARSELI